MEIVEFSKFGIVFKPLSEENLEMIRIWRNSDDVRLFMQYQKIITEQQQKEWFQKLDQSINYYFITYQNEVPFGVYNIKDIDFTKGMGETGSYLKNRDFWEGDASMRGVLSIIIFAFEVLKLNSLKSHVLKKNKRALVYNEQIGFKIQNLYDESISFELILKKEDFYTNKKIIGLIKYLEIN